MDGLEIGSVIDLSDDNSYCVVDKFNVNNTDYIYLVDTELEHMNFIMGKIENDTIVELSDKNEIDFFMKKVYEHTHNNEYFERLLKDLY